MSHGSDSVKTIFYALGANSAIAVAKFVAAFITGSGSMLAEAVHSSADCANQLLLLLGIKKAKQPPTADYPLGFGKEAYFWSFIVALMLFSMGGLVAIYEGIHKFQEPEEIIQPWLAIGVLVFAILAESVSLRACLKEINKERNDRSLRLWFKETRQSELLVVLGEDIAALFGLCVALMAIALTMFTGNPVFDAVGSIIIGILLIIVAFFIGKEVKALLIGQSVEPHVRDEMLVYFNSAEAVDQVFNLLSLQLGSDVMVAVKVKMVSYQTPREMIDAINQCEKQFKQNFPQVLWLFFEPDHQD